MTLVAGLQVDTGGVTAWVAGTDGRVAASERRPLPVRRPAPGRLEFDPTDWWAGIRSALAAAVARVPGTYLGVTVTAAREGFVLTDGRVELGQGILPEDRRGADWVAEVRAHRQLYAMTRHRPSAELPLAKLLAVRAEAPRRWAAARRLLFLHDWVLWRLGRVEATEVSYACAGGLAHVSQRSWAGSLLDDLEVPRHLLAPLVDPGTVLARLRELDVGLPTGLPLVAGCGDAQLAAAGAGAAHPGVAAVLAGDRTTLLAAADAAPLDPQQRPEVATHVPPGTWAVETGCGSPGRMLDWLAGVLAVPAAELVRRAADAPPGAGGVTALVGRPGTGADDGPGGLLGLQPDTTPEDLAAAVVAGYAYAVRANLADLEDVLGYPVERLVLTGPQAGTDLARVLAAVTGRTVAAVLDVVPEILAGVALVAAATGGPATGGLPAYHVVAPDDPQRHEEPYARYLAARRAYRGGPAGAA